MIIFFTMISDGPALVNFDGDILGNSLGKRDDTADGECDGWDDGISLDINDGDDDASVSVGFDDKFVCFLLGRNDGYDEYLNKSSDDGETDISDVGATDMTVVIFVIKIIF